MRSKNTFGWMRQKLCMLIPVGLECSRHQSVDLPVDLFLHMSTVNMAR